MHQLLMISFLVEAKQAPIKKKPGKVNETSSTTSTLQFVDTTYYANKGKTITFQGNQYPAHMILFHYCVGQHHTVTTDKVLVYHGTNGGNCGDDMLLLEGSEWFNDISGLFGQ
jgi:hypothetical protein